MLQVLHIYAVVASKHAYYIMPCDTPTNMILVVQHEHPAKSVPSKPHRVMMSAKPSTHGPAEPEMPPMLYPRGGMSVCLQKVSLFSNHILITTTYPLPPFAFPYHSLFRPRLVRIWMPSIHKPARRPKPRSCSPLRVSRAKSFELPPRLPNTWLVESS
jgi:hypothetical protein